ncbi:MAG: AGE family epimerase/isomerase [Armatimonadetes bacterium]|nr:AGE family epimerase/isomerase [Armatimonadota bacterium]
MTTFDDSQLPDLKEHLLTAILPFWEQHGLDLEQGGFITHLGPDGSVTNPSEKYLVMQTRMLYSFALGVEMGGPNRWLTLARQGFDFLRRHFRDAVEDGWFWSTTREGMARDTQKRTYGHAFVILALAEYARVSRDRGALAAAFHTWSLISDCLWDKDGDGVIEACTRTWQPTEKNHTMGTHLHVLEALLSLREANEGQQIWSHVRAICDLLVTRMVERDHNCGLEHFLPDWTYDATVDGGLVNYGHNLEAAWLLLRVHQLEANPSYRDTAKAFLDYCVEWGVDRKHGGVFSHGPLGREATVREKIWWVQTEALVGFLLGYREFGDPRYWEAFASAVSFSMRHLYDPEHGEWYANTREDGTPRKTDKGFEWKAAYHVTQACAYGHRYLSEMDPPS